MKRQVKFSKEYIYKSFVQSKQNSRFKKFTVSTLKEYSFFPSSIAELGVGDGTLSEELFKLLRPERVYLVDVNKTFLRFSGSRIYGATLIQKDLCEVTVEDFDIRPDTVISSNTLHWIPMTEQEKNWFDCVKNVHSLLKEGGFFFVHQGLKWTYFPLYDLAQSLFKKFYGREVNLSDYLYYPSRKEILRGFTLAGFKEVKSKTFYEVEDFTAPYTGEELYTSFSVAGLNVFLSQIEKDEEKEHFRNVFLEYCRLYEPPVFSHRGFFALRKPYSNLKYRIFAPGEPDRKDFTTLTDLLSEVSEDFVPPLSSRSPDSFDLKNTQNTTKNDVNTYARDLCEKYWNILAYSPETDEPMGLISFTEKESVSILGKRCVYVSTICVRKKFRKAGVSDFLMKTFFSVFGTLFGGRNVGLVETRTWSTNIPSRNLFEKNGFVRTIVIENHRGEGIHTEYYVKLLF